MAVALIVAMNPFGNLPVHAFGEHVIMDGNERYQYPAIARSGAFDSAVIGNSTSRLLDPAWLEPLFGGRFANLALSDGRAWEQYQLTLLFLRSVPQPRTMLFGLDRAWCTVDADTNRYSLTRVFPAWIYDEDPWNDWLYILNWTGLENAALQLLQRLRLLQPRRPPNGFEVFVPPEAAYDAARASKHIWGKRQRTIVLQVPVQVPSESDRAHWRFPALEWLADLLEKAPSETQVILAMMPAHVAAQPQPGSADAARDDECKARLAKLASHRGTGLIDFKIVSQITTEDRNYWDALHYRLPVAKKIVDSIAIALASGADDPGGEWQYLRGRLLADN
jgi:hypothetical protein